MQHTAAQLLHAGILMVHSSGLPADETVQYMNSSESSHPTQDYCKQKTKKGTFTIFLVALNEPT
jgi:hypothetical protein